ncbi:Proteintyrosine phosphatase [Acanthamoeba castellanii str. Neff]|uniref:Proteintyrosine phosphatase n=1 Tax=Acanthamoeba castellanii (strain ATCC 30010 / Neff) TaxID=1257118 RepID=L8H408_ACACF|nr:Proteintyrosine phosphatase [Acanthamoeba castellanii str. Neff]ELR19161.1 Proteintyrosine phosphatase [Acanthamoeba castellanii str. Neff]
MKKLAIGGEPKPPNGVAAPTIVVSDAPELAGGVPSPSMKGAGSDRSDDRRKAEKKEKIERERLEKLERKEQKRLEKLEKEHKKSPKGSEIGKEGKDGGGKVVDRFLGSKVAMEKFFKKKVKEREERKEKEKEERERERILAEELSASGDEGGEALKDKKKKKKMNSKISKGYSSEGTSSNDENGGDGRKKKRKTFSTGSGSASSTSSSPSSSYTSPSPSPSTTPDKEKDPMERESEREDEKEETTDSDDSSSSDDSESEEESGQRGLLHPNSGSNIALRQQRRRKKDWTVSQEFRVLALETEEKQKPDFSFALQHKNRGGDTDYINANYIQGEQTQYIAAQAPLPNTFSDFWLMVWEQNTRVIMMLTRLTENDRTKAEIYWPRKGPLGRARGSFSGEDGGWKQYGKMRVSLVKSTIQEGDEDVTIRHFRLRNDEEPDVERQVIQIHFTGWPDFGVPQNTKAFTQLLELMESFNKEPTITGSTESNGPIVLHCSAGLGRTGTLIAAHIAAEKLKLKTVKSKEDIDMKAIVAVLREQRHTKCQYKFLHDLLNDL